MPLLQELRFLITGGAGFIGSNLTEYLLEQGAFVRVLDNFSTGKRENIFDFLAHPNFELIEGDICDLPTCHTACSDIHYILHQAAIGSVPKSIKDPISTHHNNLTGTLNIFVAAKDASVKRVIYASSSSVYGNEETLPKVEDKCGTLLSPYAISKASCELYANSFHHIYGIESIGLRYFNVFGKRQDPNSIYSAVIPIFVKSLLQNKAPVIHGDGQQSRDFVHVDNVVQANISACFAPSASCAQAYNIGCGDRIYLKDLYKHLLKLLNLTIKATYSETRQGDIKHSNADISRAISHIGYNPTVSFQKGLERCIDWYKNNL